MVRKMVLPLIPANEIMKRIQDVAKTERERGDTLHQVAISALVIAARDGQISPINKFQSVLLPQTQAALKSYVFEHCRAWMTMINGEYRVKPESMAIRAAWAEGEDPQNLLAGSFLIRAVKEEAEPKEPEPYSAKNVITAFDRLAKRVEREHDNGNEAMRDEIVEFVRDCADRMRKLVEPRRRGRPPSRHLKIVAERPGAMPH